MASLRLQDGDQPASAAIRPESDVISIGLSARREQDWREGAVTPLPR